MTIVRSLTPWIAYAILLSFTSDRVAATVATALALVLLLVASRPGRGASALVIEISSAIFFVGYAALDWSLGGSQLPHWFGPVSQAWLAATVAVSLMFGRPFTEPIARQEAPREVWGSRWFHDLNVSITRAWLIAFTVSAVVLVVATLADAESTWLTVVCIAAAIILPVLYTRRLVARTPAEAESAT